MDLLNYLVRAPQGILPPPASQLQACQINAKHANLPDATTTTTTTTTTSGVSIIPFEEWAAARDAQDAANPAGAAEIGNAVGAFHILCTRRGITPAFDITESPLSSFHGKVSFASYVVEEEGPFASKKDAKKAVAAKAMPIVQSLLEADKKVAVQDVTRQGSGSGSSISSSTGSADDSSLHGENYVGILNEFCQAAHQALPLFRFAQTASLSFTCTATLSKQPGVIFGDATRSHATKKAAKVHAARAAVHWLRENGLMEGNLPPPPPRKRARVSGGSTSGGAGAANNDDDDIDGLDVVAATLKGPSYAQQVADYCPTLGLSPPTYCIDDDPSSPALYSGAAFFTANSGISGPVGSVRHVYGRRCAREELARQVLRFLELETERRREQAVAMKAEFARRSAQVAAAAAI